MITRRPPRVTRTYQLFPYTTLCRSLARKTAALTAAGLAFEPRTWTGPGDLSGFDLILPLLAWGYPRAIARWYALLDRLEAEGLPVVNPVPVLRWNSDKAYLAELGGRGVAVVPTIAVAREEGRRGGTRCVNA